MKTWRVAFKGDDPMWYVVAKSAEDAIKQIAKANNLDPNDLEGINIED